MWGTVGADIMFSGPDSTRIMFTRAVHWLVEAR